MKLPLSISCRRARRSFAARGTARARRSRLVCAALLAAAGSAGAVDLGPFTLSGFAKAEVGRASNVCERCQRIPGEDRHRQWADDLAYGRRFGSETTHGTLFQPNIAAKFDLPRGFKLGAQWSQRFRDGHPDFPGQLYEWNATVRHEDYGAVQVGKFPSRTWQMADYPYATDIGMSPAFSDSGAGYGLMTNALRYASPIFDVADGDLVAELTWDRGDTRFEINKPRLFELWLHYGRDALALEALVQTSRNGRPSAFSHGPFTALTADPADDAKLGGSGQSVAMLLAKYQLTRRIELSGGIRFNRWSGAYAVPTGSNLWNAMFNVDWGGIDKKGNTNPGYSARSTDVMLGARYRMGRWTASAGLAHLGRARTDNPSDRGQHNAATFGSLGLSLDAGHGLRVYGSLNGVWYARKGFAPLSMPSHSAFSNVDSRVADRGNWVTLGAVYVF